MIDRIITDENICGGKPVIKGTRITVHSVLDYLSAGDSYEDVLKAYPSLKTEDILACFQIASLVLNNEYQIKPLND